jgi:glycosyltransferase involved in cell wall biosynthesis
LGRFLTYAGARAASKVLPIGEALQEDLLEHGCSKEKVQLQYMGVDARFDAGHSREHAGGGHPVRIIYAGSISEARGRDLMLQAMARVNQEACIATLTLLGASEAQYDYCTNIAASLGIEHAVRVIRRVPGSQVPEYLRDADYGLCLWQDEEYWRFNPPTKLFEYLVAGLPVLASNIRTHTHYVHDGENGYIFEYSVDGLVDVIRKAHAAHHQYNALQSNAHQAGRRFLWDAIEPGFLESMSRLE